MLTGFSRNCDMLSAADNSRSKTPLNSAEHPHPPPTFPATCLSVTPRYVSFDSHQFPEPSAICYVPRPQRLQQSLWGALRDEAA